MRAASRAVALLLATVVTVGTVAAPSPTATANPPSADLSEAESSDQCPDGGATVLVDFGDLAGDAGSDVRTACDDDAEGDRAAQSILDAGFDLTYATRSAGFVCRVDGLPADDPCVNAAPPDAYWSVWWAEAGGEWTYSTRGVGSLRTPEGGHVALVWHTGNDEAAAPSVAPGTSTAGADEDAAPRPAAEESTGLPGWAAPVVLVALLAAGALVVLRRRRT